MTANGSPTIKRNYTTTATKELPEVTWSTGVTSTVIPTKNVLTFKMGGGDFKWVCPDWKKYKVEHVPELVKVQERLAEHGLRSPWLRNEVWRYNYRPNNSPKDDAVMLRRTVFRSFKPALAAALLTVGVKYVFFSSEEEHH